MVLVIELYVLFIIKVRIVQDVQSNDIGSSCYVIGYYCEV